MSKPTLEELEKAQNEVARAYLQAVLEILFLSGHKELNFVKKTIEMPNGGMYLLQLQHVSGPKLDVEELFGCAHEWFHYENQAEETCKLCNATQPAARER